MALARKRQGPLGRKSGIRRAAKSRCGFTRTEIRWWDDVARQRCHQTYNERCAMYYKPGHVCMGGLQDHHVITKRIYATRWDPENHLLLCQGAHFWWHNRAEGGEQWRWFVLQYGESRLARLNDRRTLGRPTREEVLAMLGIGQ